MMMRANKEMLIEREQPFIVEKLRKNGSHWIFSIDMGTDELNRAFAYMTSTNSVKLNFTLKRFPGRDEVLQEFTDEVPFKAHFAKKGDILLLVEDYNNTMCICGPLDGGP
jgi:hypothetical protein